VPLSSNETLEGFATVGQTIFHTYVKSSCGASWGCWGGTTGGISICGGTGSSVEADCIDGKDDAGILYYITGVCHQIANRILGAMSPNSWLPVPRHGSYINRRPSIVRGRFGFAISSTTRSKASLLSSAPNSERLP
jgi:hypothetical protein